MAERVSAREYHEQTKHSPERLRNSNFGLDFSNKPTPYKIYEELPTVALPRRVRPPQRPTLAAIAGGNPDSGETRTPDLGDLTQLCYYAAGVTKKIRRGEREILFRAAACTGALYHVDLYLVTGDCVEPQARRDGGDETADRPDLDAGVYHFDPRTLSLDVLREGDYRKVLADATGDEERVADAPLTVVATSTWWRNAWKYRERTYRHAFWDSGTVLANLLGVAHALDLSAGVVAGFADRQVADLLGVDVEREAPLELVPVGTGTGTRTGTGIGTEEPIPDAPGVEPLSPATKPLSRREKQYDLIPAAYRGSALEDGAAAREWREKRPEDSGVGTRPPGDGARVELDPVDDARAAKTPLHRTVRRRGSCREYDRETLNFRKVSTVLDRAVSGFPADFRDPEGPALQFGDCYLVVHDVAEVAPGAYQYHPEAGELELLREGDFRREAAHLALDQRLAGDAGLCAFFLTDLDAVVERLGDRGYRAAQLEASLTAGRLYLAAYAHRDLGATGLTFYDDLVTEFFEPRSDGQTPTFLWTMGRPA
ncbi:SagB/ThcOx family dehydrogenase [Halorussus salinisoli]|uniref:SagB/ThcOx family dehydrogenase n=1 Tax=Halorussus salinisoli TaxID=2558242 RepID=UPI0010C1CF8E|nr:SagB/ThcOx family dehydrogenase [Halorussus salinisoli]